MRAPRGDLRVELERDGEERLDGGPPCELLPEKGVDDAISDTAQGYFGEVVVPQLLFVAEALALLPDLK